jgi:hypothetical protein
MAAHPTIYEDADYVKLRRRIAQIETTEEALTLLQSVSTAYQLSLWAVVDVIYHFQQNHPKLLPQLEEGLVSALHYDRSQVSQFKKVATVFGEVTNRFPSLSFSAHIHLAYAADYLDWDTIVSVAKQAEYNGWNVRELRYKLNLLRQEQLLQEMAKKGTAEPEKKQPGRPAEVVKKTREQATQADKDKEPKIDLREELKLREEAVEDEKRRVLTDIAIRAADAYSRYHSEFIDYLLEALSVNQWEFFYYLVGCMKRRLPMLATCRYPKKEICAAISSLLDALLKYQEGGEKDEEDEAGEAA